MEAEILIKGIKALRKDALDKKMSAFTAKQKILQGIDLASPLSFKIKYLQIQTQFDFYINQQQEFVEKRENNCYDIMFFCANVLMMWETYQKNVRLYGENYL
jgi:hypothetical protein